MAQTMETTHATVAHERRRESRDVGLSNVLVCW